jgi:hypothetical protein
VPVVWVLRPERYREWLFRLWVNNGQFRRLIVPIVEIELENSQLSSLAVMDTHR